MKFAILMGLTAAWSAAGAVCAAGEPVRDGRVEAELIARQTALVPGQTAAVGLRLKMDAGWHTYWKNPGDSGMETMIAWDMPEGFIAHDIDWPAPDYFEVGGLASFAYEGEIVLPVRIDVPADAAAGDTVTLKAAADWLVCKELCEPGTAELVLTLPVGDAAEPDPRHAELFAWADARTPHTIRSDEASALWQNGGYVLVVSGDFAKIDQSADARARFFPADPMPLAMADEQRLEPTDFFGIRLILPPNRKVDPAERLRGVLVYRNGGDEKIIQIDVPVRGVAAGE